MSQPAAPDEPKHIVAVTISGNQVSAAPVVPRGATVIWSFEGNVEAQRLTVRRKGSLTPFGSSHANQISGQMPNDVAADASFEYEILKDDQPLRWVVGDGGGCFKPIDPPAR